MRFDVLRTRSVSTQPTPKPPTTDTRLHRGHSVMPRASLALPLSLKRNGSRSHIVPSVVSHSESVLPPADELFPRPEMDPRMKRHLVRVANATSNALIKDTLAPDEPGSVLWRPAQRPRGVPGNIHVLRGAARDVSKAKDSTCIRAISDDVHASIEEFALLFKLDSSREAADHLLLFNADLVQHATLYTLVSPSGQQPRRYVGVKWALVASPSRLFRNRDFCYLECQKEFLDAKGRRGWVRSLHSLKMPCCPSLEKEHGVVRASIYRSGLTAVETDEPGVLSVTYTVELDLKGQMALELLQPTFLAQRVAALATVDKLLQQQRLSSSPLLGDLEIPARKRTRGSCHLCFREFVAPGGIRDTLASITSISTRSKRYICRKCGQGVCRRCSDDWWLDVPVVGRSKLRICTVCSAAAKQSHISAHTARAGTCPIMRPHNERPTEVEGATHPNLLTSPQLRDKRRSLSMLERPSDAASFFAQQEEIKRDLEMRAVELSRRVKLWDEMQMYDRDSSLQLSEQQHVQKRRLHEGKMEQRKHSLSRIPSSRLIEQEEEKNDEAEVELLPQNQQTRSAPERESEDPDRQERLDLYPSFVSSETSSNQEASDTEKDSTIRLTAEAGTRLSSDYRDSDLSDYEEHTIDCSGEIRTTTDVTRWWQDQQRAHKTEEKGQPWSSANLSPVQSPRQGNRGTNAVDYRGNPRVSQTQQQQQQQQQQPALMSSAKKQEMVDLFNHWKQESSNEMEQRRQLEDFEEQAQYQEEQVRRRQQSDFEEMAQYQEEQARRRRQSLEPQNCMPEIQKPRQSTASTMQQTQKPRQSTASTMQQTQKLRLSTASTMQPAQKPRQSTASAMQQIQERQRELEEFCHNRKQPHEEYPSVPRTSSNGHHAVPLRSSVAVNEQYL